MNTTEWFRSVEPLIRDFESLTVASYDGKPIIGKTHLNEALIAARSAAIVNIASQLDPLGYFIHMESPERQTIMMWNEPYILVGIGIDITLERMEKFYNALFK